VACADKQSAASSLSENKRPHSGVLPKHFLGVGVLRETAHAPTIEIHSQPEPTHQFVGTALVALVDAQRLGPGCGSPSGRGAGRRSTGHALAARAIARWFFGE